MIYRPYGKTGKNVSVLGFGSTRFRNEDLKDEDGLWRCAELIRKASEFGVNFFDVAPVYANGFAERIFGMAFKAMPTPYYVSDKSIFTADRTTDDVRRRIGRSLELLRVEKIDFFHMWSIMNIGHYRQVMAKGGPYEGAVKAKQEGLIEHICFSTHANAEENIEIIKDGAFEGMILSFNALNYSRMLPVVQAAATREMGIAIMNPLSGGMLVEQGQYFNYLMQPGDENIATAALRFISAFPGITTIISGISKDSEIVENAAAVSHDPISDRINTVKANTDDLIGRICTGCGYCAGCPQSIQIADYMQAYNMRHFPNMEYMGRVIPFNNEEQIKANNVFRALRQNSGIMPESTDNPCIKCGQCESKCTQHLPIMVFFDDITNLAERYSYSKKHLEHRILDTIKQSSSGKLGLYPAGVYTEALYAFIKESFPDQQVFVFDKNSDIWGKKFLDLTIMSPQDIPAHVDTLLITHYLYQDAIYKELCVLEERGVKVIRLHNEGDIPYFC